MARSVIVTMTEEEVFEIAGIEDSSYCASKLLPIIINLGEQHAEERINKHKLYVVTSHLMNLAWMGRSFKHLRSKPVQ